MSLIDKGLSWIAMKLLNLQVSLAGLEIISNAYYPVLEEIK